MHARVVHLVFLFLLAPLSLTVSCGALPPNQQTAREPEPIERDLSCSYFYFLWGSHEEYSGRFPEALDAYEKALVCDPTGDYIRAKLPILYLKMDEPERAISLLLQELENDPGNAEQRLLLARIYLQQQEPEQAIEQFRTIIAEDPENVQALLRLGALLSQSGNLEEGRTFFQRLLEVKPESYYAHLYLARIAVRLEEFDTAWSHYSKALALNWSADLAYEMAEFNFQQQQYQRIVDLLEAAPSRKDLDERLHLSLVQALLALDREEEAIAELGTAGTTTPVELSLMISRLHLRNGAQQKAVDNLEAVLQQQDDPEARYLLAVIYLDQEQPETALEILEGITPEDQEFENSVLLKSRILHATDRSDEALRLLRSYLGKPATDRPAFYSATATLLQENGQRSAAINLLKQGLDAYPDNERLLFDYGLQLEQTDRLEEAIAVMKTILDKNPDHAEALNFIGYTWADTDRNLEKARQYIVKAMQLKPNNGYIQDSLGWVHFKLGNLERALKELLGAAQLVPDDPYIREHLGDVYQALGRIDQARESYRLALELFEEPDLKQRVQEKIDALDPAE